MYTVKPYPTASVMNYFVVLNAEEEQEFIGNIAECYAWIKMKEKGWLTAE